MRIHRTLTRWTVIGLLLVMLTGGLLAQGAPEVINLALADLNERLGTNLTLNDFNWSWAQETFNDTSLGCPQEGQVYAQQQIVGYRFEFIVEATLYDYRVSADGELLVFCGESPVEEEGGEGDGEEAAGPEVIGGDGYTNALCPPPAEGIAYMPTRLAVDIQARVTPGLPNTLRAEPDRDAAQTGEIPGGGLFTVVDGPACDDEGYLWWFVNYDGQTGWTSEGRNSEYFIEPLPGLALPRVRPVIDIETLDLVAEISRLQGRYSGALAFGPVPEGADAVTTLVAGGDTGAEGVYVYDLGTLDESPLVLNGTATVASLAFGANPALPALGGGDGSLRLWNITPGVGLVERAFLLSQNSAVRALAFDADGSTLAAAGGQAFGLGEADENLFAINLWDVATVSQVATLRGHTDEVNAMVFTPDGGTLISAGNDGTLRWWDVAARAETRSITVETNITALALGADGSTLAVGLGTGGIALADVATGATLANLTGQHLDAISGLAFSPDGRLLVSGAVDSGDVVVWDLASDDSSERLVIGTHPLAILNVAFSADGTLIASLGAENTLRLWGLTGSFG